VLIKKKPPNPERKLMIVGTTSMKSILKDLELVECFNATFNLPCLSSPAEVTSVLSKFKASSSEVSQIASACGPLTIKELLLYTEMAIQKSPDKELRFDFFSQIMDDASTQGTSY
jgi:hypothetical protein